MILWTNIILSAAAATANAWGAYMLTGVVRVKYLLVSVLATTYCAAYIWLHFNPDSVAEWSVALRPLSIVTWIAAWIVGPFIMVFYVHRAARGIVTVIEDVVSDE